MHRIPYAALLASVLLPSYVAASKVHHARASWSAFTCSALASAKGDEASAERLFQYGLVSGMAFLSAVESGEISQQEAYEHVPSGFTWAASGPNHDFIMGRVYQAATADAWKLIYKAEDTFIADEELRRARAESAYTTQNCELVSRS